MYTKIFLYPYKQTSNTCKNLAKELNAKQIKLENSKYKWKDNHLIINWGNSNAPDYTTLNKTIKYANNKLETFIKLTNTEINIPLWTTDIEVAKTWLPDTVFARTLLTGHSGVGIVNFTGTEQAPLYTKYIPKKYEYRIHIFKTDIIDIQQKKLKNGAGKGSKIRNLANGWIYARDDIQPPTNEALTQAINTLPLLELDFGAVDIIYSKKENKYYILEVNTAPGLENTTLKKYTEAFNNVLLK